MRAGQATTAKYMSLGGSDLLHCAQLQQHALLEFSEAPYGVVAISIIFKNPAIMNQDSGCRALLGRANCGHKNVVSGRGIPLQSWLLRRLDTASSMELLFRGTSATARAVRCCTPACEFVMLRGRVSKLKRACWHQLVTAHRWRPLPPCLRPCVALSAVIISIGCGCLASASRFASVKLREGDDRAVNTCPKAADTKRGLGLILHFR